MANETNDFTHLGVTTETQRKTAVLAKALDVNIYSLVEHWANQEWETAKAKGLVTDAMLAPKVAHFAGKGIQEYTPEDGKKILKAVKVRTSKGTNAAKAVKA